MLDLFLAATGPVFKSFATDAVKEILNAHTQVLPSYPPQASHVEAGHVTGLRYGRADWPCADQCPSICRPCASNTEAQAANATARRGVKTRLPKAVVTGLPKLKWEFDVKERFAKWLDIRTVQVGAYGKMGHTTFRSAMIMMGDGLRMVKEESAQKYESL